MYKSRHQCVCVTFIVTFQSSSFAHCFPLQFANVLQTVQCTVYTIQCVKHLKSANAVQTEQAAAGAHQSKTAVFLYSPNIFFYTLQHKTALEENYDARQISAGKVYTR